MLYASTKTLVRLAFALGAFALMALSAVPAAPRSAADGGGGVQPTATPAALPDDKGGAVLGATPAPTPSAGGGKPLLDGDDDISPAMLGGAKGAQVFPNLAASLDGIAAASGEGAGLTATADAADDSPPSDDASSTAVSVYAASDISDAKSFLERHGVPVDYSGATWLEASVPARLLGALSERADVIRVEKIIPAVSDHAPLPSESPTLDPCRADVGTLTVNGLAASESRSGTWSFACVSTARSGRYARFYTFTLSARAETTLDLVTPAATETTAKVAPELTLRSGQRTSGAHIERNRGRPRNLEPSLRDALIHRTLDAGTYTVEATARDAGATGPFTLTLAYAAARAGCAAPYIGSLGNSDPSRVKHNENWPANCASAAKTDSQSAYYEFKLQAADTVEISLTTMSLGAKPFLYLRSRTRTFGASIATDDGGGRGDGAYIHRSLYGSALHDGGGRGDGAYIRRALDVGTYTIEATSQTAASPGKFHLSVIKKPALCSADLGTLAAGERETQGRWNAACPAIVVDRLTPKTGYARYYTFTLGGDAAKRVDLLLTSARADTRMWLRSGTATSGAFIAYHWGGTGINNSFIKRGLAPGTYTVEAATHYDAAGERFSLSIKVKTGCSAVSALGALTAARTVNGNWAAGCESVSLIGLSMRNVEGRYARYYTFSLSSAAFVEIDLESSAANPWLFLRAGDGTQFGSLIVEGARATSRLLAAGTYTVEATSTSPGKSAAFALSLSPTFATLCAPSPLALTDGSTTTTANQSWTNGCRSARTPRVNAKHYTFTLTSPKMMTIELDSPVADARLYLTQGGSADGADFIGDDPPEHGGLPTRASRIERILGAGTYTVEAASAKPDVAGAFTLAATPAAITPRPSTPSNACIKDLGTLPATFDVRDSWVWGDCGFGNLELDNIFTFTLAAPAVVAMDLFPHTLNPGPISPMEIWRYHEIINHLPYAGGWLRLCAQSDYVPISCEGERKYIQLRYPLALEAGTYLLVARPRHATDTDGFGFRMRASAPATACAATALGELTSGATAQTGTWSDDCGSARRAGAYSRNYSFSLARRSEVTIDLTSSAVDPYLYLMAATTTMPILAEDDDGGDGTNSRITATLEASTPYALDATTDARGETGGFSMTIDVAPVAAPPAPPPCAAEDMGVIRNRATRNGTWSDDCGSDPTGWDIGPEMIPSNARSYTFTLAERSVVTIDASGPGADPIIMLRGVSGPLSSASGPLPSGMVRENDDDDGIGLYSRIRRFLDAGTYIVEVGELLRTPTRGFAFSVSAGGLETASDCETSLGTITPARGSVVRAGMWTYGCDSENLNGAYARRYEFTLENSARVNIATQANRNSILYLKRVGATSRPSHLNVNANSPDWLVPVYLSAGSYEVEAVAPARWRGAFIIAISVDDPLEDGASVHNSTEWNDAGYTGAGVKVGVIDNGFRLYSDLRMEIPAPAGENCAPGQPSDCLSAAEAGAAHGAAVAEAIHDIAPDAALYLSKAQSRGELSAAVDWMIEQGVDVINMSLSWSWDGPPGGSSPYGNGVGRSIDRAVRSGATWVNSAGNSATRAWSGEYADADSDSVLEFAPGDETNSLSPNADLPYSLIEMRWDDDWGGADSDLDLYVLDSLNRVVASSRDYQAGRAGHIPYERILLWTGSSPSYRIAVRHAAGSAPAWVQVRDMFDNAILEHPSAGSIAHPGDGDNPGMLAVGAAPWYDMSAPEPFSGLGPTADGRTKPDIVAADRGMSSVYAGEFSGTSQASPHVAGMAALLKGRYPDMRPEQIARYLKDQASPRPETPDGSLTIPNNAWGYGVATMPGSPIEISGGQSLRVKDAPDAGDALGYSVAISADGNTAVAGAPTHDGGGSDAGAAFVFVKSEEGWSEIKLTSPDAAASQRFGESVSISADGGFAIVGSPGNDTNRGAAYIFKKPATGWADTSTAAAKLTARDGWNLDQFGISVSMSADGASVVVGARGDDSDKGAAYVFTKPTAGWRDSSGAAKLAAADGAARDLFGDSVSISGDGLTVVAGAPGHDDGEGAAYIFAKPGAWWGRALISSSTKLTDADGKPGARFGDSVSASANGGVIAVGAPANAYEKGAARVFVKPSGGWASAASSIELTAADGEYGGAFGTSISVSGDGAKILVGALENGESQSGAYLFAKPASSWASASASLVSGNGLADRLGWSVSLNSDGGAFAMGAPRDSFGDGSVSFYEKTSDGYGGGRFRLTSDYGDRFGASVSMSEDMSAIAVGAYGRDGNANDAGAVYVFGKPSVGWTSATSTPAKLTASDGAVADRFGYSVSVSDNSGVIVVGAPDNDSYRGAAYVFAKPLAGWGTGAITAAAKLTASDGASLERFGISAAVSGDGGVVVVGATRDDYEGAAYVFVKPAFGGWGTSPLTETAKLTASDGATDDRFGFSVAISADGGAVAVGAPDHVVSAGVSSGAAYVFVKPDGGAWASSSTAAKLTPPDSAGRFMFGISVSISADGGVVAVGAPMNFSGTGAAYIFTKPDTGWASTSAAAKIAPRDGEIGDDFGASVSISADGGLAVVGSPRDNFYDSRVGSAYAFAKPEGGWASGVAGVKIIAPGANAVSSEFGAAAALGGDIIAVGAPGEDWHTGRAYAFDMGTVKRISAPPTLTVTGPVAIVNEGDEAEFPVRMDPKSGETVSVEYRVASGSTDSATPGADYESASGALIFAPGETRKTVRVEVKTDAEREPTETFSLHLHAASGAMIDADNARAVVSIANRDTPVLSISRTSLSFALDEDDPANRTGTQSFDVWNAGSGSAAFSVSVSDGADWLTVSPSSETSTGAADRKTVTATASAAGLPAGDYDAAITISADGVTDAVARVSLTVTANPPAPDSPPLASSPPSTGGESSGGSSGGGGGGGGGGGAAPRLPDPALAFAPSALSFIAKHGGETTTVARRFEVWNAERGDMGFGVSSSASWLSFSPRRQVSEGPTSRVTVTATANIAGLEPGAHSATITIAQLSGEEESETLPVTLTITDAASSRTTVSPQSAATIASPDTTIRLYMPPGAASVRGEIQLRKLSAADFSAPGENERVALAVDLSAYRIGGTRPIAASYPDGVDLRFALPAGEETACDDGMIRLYRVAGTTWTLLDHRCETDSAGKSWAITTLTSFSEYAMTLAEAASSPTPTPTPEPTPIPAPEIAPTPEPTATATPMPEPTAIVAPAPEPTAIVAPAPEPTATSTPAPEPTATAAPAPQPTATATPAPEPTATAIPALEPTVTATSTPAPAPAPEPTHTPAPTQTAAPEPTPQPTSTPAPTRTSIPAPASMLAAAPAPPSPTAIAVAALGIQTSPPPVAEAPADIAPAQAADDDESGNGAPPALAIAVGLALFAILASAALMIMRRRLSAS